MGFIVLIAKSLFKFVLFNSERLKIYFVSIILVLKKFTKEGKIAFKCKLIALIQLGLWEDALLLIKKTPAAEMG